MGDFIKGNQAVPADRTNAPGRGPATEPFHIDAEFLNFAKNAAVDLRTHTSGWFNVRSYGAKGDGATDDAGAINAAISAATAAGGGTVFFPPGDYSVRSHIFLKSDVRLEGAGRSSQIRARDWVPDLYSLLYAPRELGPYKNIAIEKLLVEGALPGSAPGHANGGAAILVSNCDGVLIADVVVTAAEDAGIRLDGYDATTEFPIVDHNPDTNPGFGHLSGGLIRHCEVSGSYIGIELEGGASAVVVDNLIHDTVLHGIRLPHARDSLVERNKINRVGGAGVYLDYVNRTSVRANEITGSTDQTKPDIALGHCFDCDVSNNLCSRSVAITDGYFVSEAEGIAGARNKIAGNLLPNGDLRIYHQDGVDIRNNVAQNLRVEKAATGVVQNNVAFLIIPSSKLVANGGADVVVSGNVRASRRPQTGVGQAVVLGSAASAPASGTYDAGHLLWNSTPGLGKAPGWVCVSAGTPGTWLPFASFGAAFARELHASQSGNNQVGRTLATLTVPAAALSFMVEVEAVVSRAPFANGGISRVAKRLFHVGRVGSGSDVVITSLTGGGEYDLETPSAGGTGNVTGAANLTLVRAGAEPNTDSQAIRLTVDCSSNGVVVNARARLRLLGDGVDTLGASSP